MGPMDFVPNKASGNDFEVTDITINLPQAPLTTPGLTNFSDVIPNNVPWSPNAIRTDLTATANPWTNSINYGVNPFLAWTDLNYRDSLTPAQLATLPANPAGDVQLNDPTLFHAANAAAFLPTLDPTNAACWEASVTFTIGVSSFFKICPSNNLCVKGTKPAFLCRSDPNPPKQPQPQPQPQPLPQPQPQPQPLPPAPQPQPNPSILGTNSQPLPPSSVNPVVPITLATLATLATVVATIFSQTEATPATVLAAADTTPIVPMMSIV